MGRGEKYEKLDVGSFTVTKCNDAFTAGPHDDITDIRSKYTDLNFANTDLNCAQTD